MSGKRHDHTGKVYGRLTVLRYDHTRERTSSQLAVWLCRCECGVELLVPGASLTRGQTSSCGAHKAATRMCDTCDVTKRLTTEFAQLKGGGYSLNCRRCRRAELEGTHAVAPGTYKKKEPTEVKVSRVWSGVSNVFGVTV